MYPLGVDRRPPFLSAFRYSSATLPTLTSPLTTSSQTLYEQVILHPAASRSAFLLPHKSKRSRRPQRRTCKRGRSGPHTHPSSAPALAGVGGTTRGKRLVVDARGRAPHRVVVGVINFQEATGTGGRGGGRTGEGSKALPGYLAAICALAAGDHGGVGGTSGGQRGESLMHA